MAVQMTSFRRLLGALMVASAVALSHPIHAATPAFAKSIIDRAMGLPLLRLNDPDGLTKISYPYGSVGPAVHYLALVAFTNPGATSSTGTLVADRVSAHLSNVVRSGNEPRLLGGFYAWNEHHLAGIIALARHTPAVWGKVAAADKERLEWLMQIGAYIGNLQHNAGNDCNLSPNLWSVGGTNPNQTNGMAAWMSYAYIYFGSADAVNAMLAAFDLNRLISKATEFGWSFIRDWAKAPSTKTLFTEGGRLTGSSGTYCQVQAKGVRAPFTFNGRTVSGDPKCPSWTARPGPVKYEPFSIYRRSEYEWNLAAAVVDLACKSTTHCGTAGRIKPGMNSPHLGKIGMFLEYNLNGRSSPSYVAIGRRISMFHIATLMATGFWRSGVTDYDQVLGRLSIANDVYMYRQLSNAWYDPEKCAYATPDTKFGGHDFVDDLWIAIVSPKNSWTYGPIRDGNSGAIAAPSALTVH